MSEMNQEHEARTVDLDQAGIDRGMVGGGALTAGTLSGRVIQVAVKPGVSAESLHQALNRIFELGGCLQCGLVGFDIHLLGGDPPFMDRFRGIEGIANVNATRRL